MWASQRGVGTGISNTLDPNEKMVHIAFRASNVDFLNLMQRCPRLRTIQVPLYQKTMSNAIQLLLEMQGIELLEGDVWGHRKIWMSTILWRTLQSRIFVLWQHPGRLLMM